MPKRGTPKASSLLLAQVRDQLGYDPGRAAFAQKYGDEQRIDGEMYSIRESGIQSLETGLTPIRERHIKLFELNNLFKDAGEKIKDANGNRRYQDLKGTFLTLIELERLLEAQTHSLDDNLNEGVEQGARELVLSTTGNAEDDPSEGKPLVAGAVVDFTEPTIEKTQDVASIGEPADSSVGGVESPPVVLHDAEDQSVVQLRRGMNRIDRKCNDLQEWIEIINKNCETLLDRAESTDNSVTSLLKLVEDIHAGMVPVIILLIFIFVFSCISAIQLIIPIIPH